LAPGTVQQGLEPFRGQDAVALGPQLRFAGREGSIPSDAVWLDEPLAASVDAYRAMWAEVDAVVAAEPDLETPCRAIGDRPQVNLRWVLMHLLEETARHAGHADILREQLDGQTGR
jgi:hypothetical protein